MKNCLLSAAAQLHRPLSWLCFQMYALLLLQDKLAHNERFVVRSKHPRKDVESGLYLYDHLKNQPELGGYQISIPQKGVVDKRGKRKNRPARKASLSLRSGRITLKQGNITLNAVLAEEINPPKGETPLKWLLLTSEPVESLAQALRVIDIYTHRWRIEEFHKAWKTGAGAERQRMEEPDNLERMVSILSFVAVRLLQLREISMVTATLMMSNGQGKRPAECGSA